EIHRAGAERIAGAAGHEARQIGLALDHLRRRPPVRPFRLAHDELRSAPLEPVTADADTVAQGAVATLNEIKEAVGGVDDDGAGLFLRPVEHRLHLIFGRQALARRSAVLT